MKWKTLVVLLISIFVMSLSGTTLAQTQSVTVTSISVDTTAKSPLVCLNMDLTLNGLANKYTIVAAIPVNDKGDQIVNTSGDPSDTWKTGTVLSHVKLDKDSTNVAKWNNIKVCVNTDHFQLSEQMYTFYVVLAFFDESNGNLIGDLYDTSQKVGEFTILAATAPQVRITNVVKTVGPNLAIGSIDIGVTYTVTFEAWRLKGKALTVNMLPVTKDGTHVKNLSPKSNNRTVGGDIVSTLIVTPLKNDQIWGDWQNDSTSQSLSFYVSFYDIPIGTIYPSFVVVNSDKKTTVLLERSFIDENLSVVVKPS